MQCRDVRELADSFLSEQLLVETNHELLRHLETCPDCRADIAGRRALRDRLRAAFARADELAAAAGVRGGAAGGAAACSASDAVETFGAAIVVGARGGPCPCRRRRVVRAPARARVRAWPRSRATPPAIIRTARSDSISPSGRSRSKTPAGATVRRTPRSRRSSRQRSTDRWKCWSGMPVSIRDADSATSCFATAARSPRCSSPKVRRLRLQSWSRTTLVPPWRRCRQDRFLGFVVADLDRRSVLRLAQTLARPLSQHLA